MMVVIVKSSQSSFPALIGSLSTLWGSAVFLLWRQQISVNKIFYRQKKQEHHFILFYLPAKCIQKFIFTLKEDITHKGTIKRFSKYFTALKTYFDVCENVYFDCDSICRNFEGIMTMDVK